MNDKYLKGTVFKLQEDSDRLYLLVEKTMIEDEQFLLVMPVEDIKKIEIDIKKFILLRVTKDDEIIIETNPELIEKILRKVFEKANNN